MKLLLILLFSFGAFAKNVALVKLFRGSAKVIASDSTQKSIAMGMWINEGDIIKTNPNSFVRLSFIDKSTVNVGPQSELKVEKFSKNEAGVLDVIQGKIRAKVSKDYLDMDESQSKLFVKSKSAVMGIRGTDFVYSVGSQSEGATAILFEGSVVFNKINKSDNLNNLESIVNRGRKINPGSFSVVSPHLDTPTIAAKLNKKQLKAMEKDINFSNETLSQEKHKKNSKVPPGISGAVVSSSESSIKDTLSKELSLSASTGLNNDVSAADIESTKYQETSEGVRPADGTIVVLDSNTILPVGVDATFDSNTKEWVSSDFHIGESGEIISSSNIEIKSDGSIQKTVNNKTYTVSTQSVFLTESQSLEFGSGDDSISANQSPEQISGSNEDQKNSANANDWFTPPAQVNTPVYQGGQTTPTGMTKLKATVTQGP